MIYNDLPDHPAYGILLSCLFCGGEHSATAGDYFLCDGTDTIECGECGEPLGLYRRLVTFKPVEIADA